MSKRLVLVSCLVIGTATSASAQVQSAVAQCHKDAQEYQSKAIAEGRARGPLDVAPIFAGRKRITQACADKIPTAGASVVELAALTSLYILTGDTAKARSLMTMAMSHATAPETDRAEAMLAAVQFSNATLDPFSGINQDAEGFVSQLDAMSDAVIMQKIRSHQTMLGRYNYADIDDGIRDHAGKLLDLGQRALRTGALGKIAIRGRTGKILDSASAAYPVLVQAYTDLARAAGDYLHADSALMILDEGDRVTGTAYPPARETFERERQMYRLVGTSATPINGKWWINAPNGTTIKPGNGKVSIVQFTAHWCVPCKQSYAPMNRLMAKYAGKPVESVMTTGLYGYVGDKKNLTPEQEVEADRAYYKEHHGLSSAISIVASAAESNDDRYAVGGIPEIVIIDKTGVIRATVVGWDVGNEKRFAAFIDKLLKEK